MDPLSEVLAVLKPANLMSAGVDAGNPWAIAFRLETSQVKCGAIVSGQCLLRLDKGKEVFKLGPGDVFLLPHEQTVTLCNTLALPPEPAAEVFASTRNGGISVVNGGGECFILSSKFKLEGDNSGVLLNLLPPVILLKNRQTSRNVQSLVTMMMHELATPSAGSSLSLQHLAHMMFIASLRGYLDSHPQQIGWIYGLNDPQIGAALGLIHSRPAVRWTLNTMAREVGMSRSVFSQRFKALVGVAPIDYLTRWRMFLAADDLRHTQLPIAAISEKTGYDSESAFSSAFKRVMGMSPRAYANQPPR